MTDAEKREKVIKGLECCIYDDCEKCDYKKGGCLDNTKTFMNGLKRDAIALLKAQEPRVMTLEEIRDALKKPLWKECKSGNKALYTGWVLAYDVQTGEGITGTRLGMAEPSGRVVWYKLDDYGKTWRCWISRPTDEQREKEPWNG